MLFNKFKGSGIDSESKTSKNIGSVSTVSMFLGWLVAQCEQVFYTISYVKYVCIHPRVTAGVGDTSFDAEERVEAEHDDEDDAL